MNARMNVELLNERVNECMNVAYWCGWNPEEHRIQICTSWYMIVY